MFKIETRVLTAYTHNIQQLNMSHIRKEPSYAVGNGHFSDIELEETFSSKSSFSESNSLSSIVNTLTGSKQQLNEDMELILGSENTGDKRRWLLKQQILF